MGVGKDRTSALLTCLSQPWLEITPLQLDMALVSTLESDVCQGRGMLAQHHLCPRGMVPPLSPA
jgi:hypothetical protein